MAWTTWSISSSKRSGPASTSSLLASQSSASSALASTASLVRETGVPASSRASAAWNALIPSQNSALDGERPWVAISFTSSWKARQAPTWAKMLERRPNSGRVSSRQEEEISATTRASMALLLCWPSASSSAHSSRSLALRLCACLLDLMREVPAIFSPRRLAIGGILTVTPWKATGGSMAALRLRTGIMRSARMLTPADLAR
mmetsp:Transcript_11069/g.45151  ORF Transcript_11069/g.45151 Transcript_11069/m.45151 type:complete len:203 (-) Transcript_11069:1191-1799(-)